MRVYIKKDIGKKLPCGKGFSIECGIVKGGIVKGRIAKSVIAKSVILSAFGVVIAIALSFTQVGIAQPLTNQPSHPPSSPYVSQTVALNLTAPQGVGNPVGTIVLQDSEYGLILTPSLTSLSPGIHGFHIHANPDCGATNKEGKPVPGLAAGGHFDPSETNIHEGPYADGHLGDLPPLPVDAEGNATTPVLAPRLTVATVSGRSLMVHTNGDNFSDDPAPLGGGGARLACGIIASR